MNPFLAELIGTAILILLGNGVVAGVVLNESKAAAGGWIVITLAWGLAVTLGIYAVGDISGAHLNPAVTLSLASIGEFPWQKVPIYICGQVLGAIIGAVLVWIHYLPHWKKTEDPASKLACFSTAPAIRSIWANLVSEMLGTFFLILALLFIGSNEFTEGLNPLIVGFLILAIGLSLGGTTGYAINPARDLGPRIAHALLPIAGKGNSDWKYSWIPILGPIIGGITGSLFYNALFKGNFNYPFWIFSVVFLLIILKAISNQLKEDKK